MHVYFIRHLVSITYIWLCGNTSDQISSPICFEVQPLVMIALEGCNYLLLVVAREWFVAEVLDEDDLRL